MNDLVIITGTTQGLGRALAGQLGDVKVIAINRRESGAAGEMLCDLAENDDVALTADRLLATVENVQKLTFFVNAASYGDDQVVADITTESAGKLLYTNVFSQLSLVEKLLGAGKHVRLVAISSSMGSVKLAPEPYHFLYSASKAALNVSVRLMKRRGDAFDYLLVDPGWMQTQMGGVGATETPTDVAKNLLKLMAKPGSWNRTDGMIEVNTGRIIPW
jgi:NAD(P)-dependent dehydrogenase (short-subunit alcohol dehydrogenase family)